MSNDRKSKPFKISFSKIFNDIKEKISKITSFKIKENKALNETEFIIKGENKMPEEIIKKGKTKKDPKLNPEIQQFMEEQKKFNSDVKEFIQEQKKFNSDIKEFIQNQNKFNNEIKEFIQEQKKFNNDVKQFMQDQNKKWEEQSKVNQVVLTSIQEILLRLGRIEKCPTIKKELDELE